MRKLAACTVMIAVAAVAVLTQGATRRSAVLMQASPPFQYSIIANEAKPDPDNAGKVLNRMVDVLIDPKDFSEANLTVLFRYLAPRYPKPSILDIVIHTDRKTFDTPDALTAGRRNAELYPTAWYSRFLNGSGAFSYTVGEPGKYKTVFVKINK